MYFENMNISFDKGIYESDDEDDIIVLDEISSRKKNIELARYSYESQNSIQKHYDRYEFIQESSQHNDDCSYHTFQTIDYEKVPSKRKKRISSSSCNLSQDCIILDDEICNDTSTISFSMLKIETGMKVFALYDKLKHIWKPAILVEIKDEEERYVVKFESNKNENTYKKGAQIICEYENNLDEDLEKNEFKSSKFNIENKKTSSFNCHTDSKEEIYNEFVELDRTSISFAKPGMVEFNEVYIKIKSRIISDYTLIVSNGDSNLLYSDHMCSGTIAELPCKKNKNRHLIFFDNGFVSYANHEQIYYIFDHLSMPVERLSFDHIYFLRSYFENYPNRSMTQLNRNDILTIYLNDKWQDCKVLEVNGSLAKLELDIKKLKTIPLQNNFADKKLESHTIWFYRGSPRLLPIYEAIMNRIAEHNDETIKQSAFEQFVIEKQKNQIDDSKRDLSIINHCFSSTQFPKYGPENKSKEPGLCKTNSFDLISKTKEDKALGEIVNLDLTDKIGFETADYLPHDCSQYCVYDWEDGIDIGIGANPLLIPGMYGWKRQIFYQSKTKTSGVKKWINYLAPCGRTLRSTGEVDRYLFFTDSKLTIDMFSFDYYIHTNREFKANSKYLYIEDLSNSKELVPISCVNSIDSEKPEEFEYSPTRKALNGVPLNTDPKLLEGCNCEDNCRDRSKCSCWRKTFEMTTFSNENEMNVSVGYRYRRLQQMVSTGVFECNSLCKCDHRCSNRVVQNGTNLRIQLFKTANKGWGIRCLDDVPKGSFISIYSGHIMSEEQSYIRNLEYSDKYFAELDFIECVRRLKEGYIEPPENIEPEGSDSDVDSSNSSGYEYKSRILPRRSICKINQKPEIEYICLDSDEDEQDRSPIRSPIDIINETDNDISQNSNNEEKKRQLTTLIESNRYFTNKNNKIFSEYLKNSKTFIMDASFFGNISRFFNHSCSPNVFVQNVFIDTYDFRFPLIAFFAMNFIKAGTELCWDYGYVIDSVKDRKLNCYCNSSRCRGRLL